MMSLGNVRRVAPRWPSTRWRFAVSVLFLLFCSFSTSSTASSDLFSQNFSQIVQQFPFPYPKLAKILFGNVGQQCKDTVEKLSAKLAFQCKYDFKPLCFKAFILSCLRV